MRVRWFMTAFVACCVLASRASAADRPNFLFLLADDVGYGDLGCTGHPYARTPTIDALAKQGTFFRNFYVGGPTCCPSRTALMTGKYCATFAKYPATYGLGKAVTVTELLKRIGYRTGHIGKWHIGQETKNGTYGIDVIKPLGGNRRDPRGRDAEIADETIAFLKANKAGPFYLNVWFHTVHNPVNPPQGFVDRFKNLTVNPADFKNPDEARELAEWKKSGEDIDQGMRKHLGDLWQLDDHIARILKALDDLGLAKDTIVIFTSDNGPHGYGSAGLFRGKKHSLHDGGVHLPLIVRWPGHVPAGRTDNVSVMAGIDWLPTICSLAKAKKEMTTAGEDVSDLWLGKERARTTDLFWRVSNPKAPGSMVRGRWKLYQVRKGAPELYDLSKDPGERKNVAVQQPAIVSAMDATLNRWIATLPKTYEGTRDDKE
jgi:arylsulfatase A-like enzyme